MVFMPVLIREGNMPFLLMSSYAKERIMIRVGSDCLRFLYGIYRIDHRLMAAIFVVLGLLTINPSNVFCEELTVAAASDLNYSMKEMVAKFEKASGVVVKLSLGNL